MNVPNRSYMTTVFLHLLLLKRFRDCIRSGRTLYKSCFTLHLHYITLLYTTKRITKRTKVTVTRHCSTLLFIAVRMSTDSDVCSVVFSTFANLAHFTNHLRWLWDDVPDQSTQWGLHYDVSWTTFTNWFVGRWGVVDSTLAFGSIGHWFESEHR